MRTRLRPRRSSARRREWDIRALPYCAFEVDACVPFSDKSQRASVRVHRARARRRLRTRSSPRAAADGWSTTPSRLQPTSQNRSIPLFFIRLSANALDSSFIAARVFAHTNNPPVFSSSLCTGLGFPSAPPATAGGSPSTTVATPPAALSVPPPPTPADPLPTDTTSSGFTTIAQCASSYATATSSYVPSARSRRPRAPRAPTPPSARAPPPRPRPRPKSRRPRESLTWTKLVDTRAWRSCACRRRREGRPRRASGSGAGARSRPRRTATPSSFARARAEGGDAMSSEPCERRVARARGADDGVVDVVRS